MKTPQQIREFFDSWCESALLSARAGDPHQAGMASGALLTLAAVLEDETAKARARAVVAALRALSLTTSVVRR